jgi:hypothetical protein
MRFKEIMEGRPSLKRGSFTIQIDDHAIKRTQERNIDPAGIDQLIDRIPSIKAKILQFVDGEQFYVFNNDLNIGLGVKMVDAEHRIIRLKTVIGQQPSGVKLPVIHAHL